MMDVFFRIYLFFAGVSIYQTFINLLYDRDDIINVYRNYTKKVPCLRTFNNTSICILYCIVSVIISFIPMYNILYIIFNHPNDHVNYNNDDDNN